MTEQNFSAMRRAMVESQLRTNDVNDPDLLAAILSVPREAFAPAPLRMTAYVDRPLPLGNGRALNPPVVTARLLTEAQLIAGERCLLIGAATGYAAALLARLGVQVVALEEDEKLLDAARATLGDTVGITITQGPLAAGHAKSAPYDLLVIDGAVEQVPDALVDQLRVGGRAVFATVDRGVTRLCIGVRTEGGFGARCFADAEAVRLPGFAPPKGFSF